MACRVFTLWVNYGSGFPHQPATALLRRVGQGYATLGAGSWASVHSPYPNALWLKDFQDAYRRAALRVHPLRSSQRGERSIYLAGRWRLIVMKGDNEQTVNIDEVSNHYGD